MNLERLLILALRSAVAVLVAAGLSACGGSDGDDNAPSAGATIGAAGGTLAGPGGAQLVIPVGALAQPAPITITQDGAGAPALPPGSTALGAMFALTPHGTAFAAPATLSVPFDPSLVPAGSTPAMLKTNAAQTGWDVVAGATVAGSSMQAPVSSFSWVIIVVPLALPTIAVQPATQSVVEPNVATFSVGAIGPTLSGLLSFQWKRNGAVISGATGSGYSTGATTVAADNGAMYSVDVSNRAGTVSSRDATLSVTTAPPPPAPAQGARIAAGGGFSLAVDRAGTPYSWGNDSAGQLGNGEPNASRSTAAPLGTLTGVRSVAAGGEYQGVAIRTDGSVWAWGYRGFVDCAVGALASSPFQIADAANITAVSAGQDHTLLLRNDKAVLAYGCNGNRQLGQSSQQVPPMSPAMVVAGLPPIKAVAAGAESSLALDEAGEVWAWGRKPGDRSASSASNATPTKVAGLSGVIAIHLAEDHALALKSDGSVWAWGSNRNGKLGDGTEIDRPAPTATLLTAGVTAICAGGDLSLALRADGTVISWGINETGQLGSGSSSPGFRPQPAPVVGLATVVAIACGSTQLSHALALLADGTVRGWGRNGEGQLGDGSRNSALAPVVVTGLNLN